MSFWSAADRGDIVLGWLTKVVVVLSLLGVAGYDGVSLLHAQVQVSDTADQAAIAARDAWQDTKNADAAFAAAHETAAAKGGTVQAKGMVINADGSVRVTVHERAHTFVLRHIGKLKAAADVTGHGRAQPVL